MKRRRLVVGMGTALFTSGCLSTGGSDGPGEVPLFELNLRPVNNTQIARLHAIDISAFSQHRRAVYREAIQNGYATARFESDSVHKGAPAPIVRSRGTVYQLRLTQIETEGVTEYQYRGVFESVTEPQPANTIPYTDLPSVDQEALAEADLSSPNGSQVAGIGVALYYAPAARNESVLVPSPVKPVIRWPSGVAARLEVAKRSSRKTLRLRINATEMGSLSEFGQQLGERFAFTLSNTSDAEDDVLQQAIRNEEGYVLYPVNVSEGEGLPPGPKQLKQRLTTHGNESFQRGHLEPPVEPDVFLFRCRNRTYWAEYF